MTTALIILAGVMALAGTILYTPICKKMSGVIGVGGAYMILIGIMCFVMLLGGLIGGTLFENTAELAMTLIFMLIGIGYMVYVMIARCESVIGRILLPFAAILMGFGFCWRFLAALVFHIPMGGKTAEQEAKKTVFPKTMHASNGDVFELTHEGGDLAEYYCRRTGDRVTFRDSDFDEGAPNGWNVY